MNEIQDINQQEFDVAMASYYVDQGLEKWVVTDEETANKYMRIIRKLEQQKDEVGRIYAKEVQRIESFYDAELDELDRKSDFFKEFLMAYYKRQRELNPKFQLKTPWGKVTSRKVVSPTWQDEAAVLDWLKANKRDDLVKVEESVKKAELKKAFEVVGGQYVDTTTGEVVPGVSVEEKTSIKVSVEV